MDTAVTCLTTLAKIRMGHRAYIKKSLSAGREVFVLKYRSRGVWVERSLGADYADAVAQLEVVCQTVSWEL